MAEAAGLAFAIPGLFTTGVQCFEWVQLAREFEKDYATSCVQLQLAQLRLLRWGEAVGLRYNCPSSSGHAGSISSFEIDELKIIWETLSQIKQDFARAENITARSRPRMSNLAQTRDFHAVEFPQRTDTFDRSHRVLRNLTHTAISKYKGLASVGHDIAGRTSWVLYRRDHFNSLISSVTMLVRDLEELFPAVRVRELKLGRQEVANAIPEDLPLLLDAVGDQDDILKEAIGAEVEVQVLTFDRITIEDDAKTHLGQIFHERVVEKSGSKYTNMVIGGRSVSHLGNIYRGSGV